MKHKFSTALLGLLIAAATVGFSTFAQIQTFDPKETREMLLKLTQYDEPMKIVVKGEYKSPEAKRFMQFFLTELQPEFERTSLLILRYKVYHLLLDAGAYENESEQKEWQDKMQGAISELNEFEVSEDWTAKISEAARLAEGLTGEYPESVLRAQRERMQEVFAPEYKPLLDEMEQLSSEYGLAINQAEANKHLREMSQTLSETVLGFRNGKVSFEEAYKTLTDLHSQYGYRYVGYEAVQADPSRLNRVAEIRSILAKSKGYKTWAEMILSNDEGYSEEYRGVAKQREFLKSMIQTLAPQLKRVIDGRMEQLGIDPTLIKEEHISLVLPKALSHLKAYFPPAAVTPIWLEVMKESGFDDKALSQILVDDQQREKKNATGAYMMSVYSQYLEEEVVDAGTLSPITPSKNSELWQDGLTYILQTYKTGGVADLETMFHEGGHALEKAYKFKNRSNPEAYAYVETPSMTMEYFMSDPMVLWEKAVPVDGEKPSMDEIEQLVRNARIANAYTMMDLAQSALFDIDLWDYDYSQQGAKTFLERVREVEEAGRILTMGPDALETPVPHFYSKLATSHFYSGTVRYTGYVFADMSSRMMKDFITDEIEKASGRRTWHKQSGMKELFADRFFAEGWKLPFPQNIEAITGRSYDPQEIIGQVIADLSDCAHYLK